MTRDRTTMFGRHHEELRSLQQDSQVEDKGVRPLSAPKTPPDRPSHKLHYHHHRRSSSDSGVQGALPVSHVASVGSSVKSAHVVPENKWCAIHLPSLFYHKHQHQNLHEHQHNHHHHNHLHRQQPSHRSQPSIPGLMDKTSTNGISNELKGKKKSHSQSSLLRLGVRSHTDQGSSSTLSRAHGALSDEEEVTYVWRDGRVQLQHARNAVAMGSGMGSSSGQHVEYLWQSGNVQKVIRGSNNELLSAEIVPPRGPVKGMNYCALFSAMAFLIVSIVTLIFILKVFY